MMPLDFDMIVVGAVDEWVLSLFDSSSDSSWRNNCHNIPCSLNTTAVMHSLGNWSLVKKRNVHCIAFIVR